MHMKLWVAVLPLMVTSTLVQAAPHADDWCADAVSFAMQMADARASGETHDKMTQEIDKQAISMQQFFPALKLPEMHALVDQAYAHKWTRFGAATAVSRSCGDRPPVAPIKALAAAHTDAWCASAVDYSLSTAQKRAIGYGPDEMQQLLTKNRMFFQRNYPELTDADLNALTEAVFSGQPSRFNAARAVSLGCRVAPG